METVVPKMFQRQFEAALENPEMVVGTIVDVCPYELRKSPGIAVRVCWVDDDGKVSSKIIWIHIAMAPTFLDVANTVLSEKFAAKMDELQARLPCSEVSRENNERKMP